MIFLPHRFQQDAANFLAWNPFSALLADPGTGKTTICLAVIKWSRNKKPGWRTLVLSSLGVIDDAWPNEVKKWDQFAGMTYRRVHGKNKLDEALADADFHLMNFEGVKWAAKNGVLATFDALFIDESSLVKNWMSERMKYLRQYLPRFSRRHILTGSPTPQSLHDYFSQQYIVDLGYSLGTTITPYRQEFFYDATPKKKFSTWRPRPGAMPEVLNRINLYAMRLDAEKLLELPEFVYNDISIQLPKPLLRDYRAQVRNAASAGKGHLLSRQLAGGFTPEGEVYHDFKMQRLERLVTELNGEPLIVFPWSAVEGAAIASRFNCPLVNKDTPKGERTAVLEAWKRGELPIAALSPVICGHGKNLQTGGHHMVWFSLTPNLDVYFQANRRLRRQGQDAERVFVHRLICEGTVDPALVDTLAGKDDAQQEFLAGILRAA